ncbi:hypothetical protein C2845_PM11G29050 [Panicum miliaceum]|uniref:Uncharacterized protein n=1 Tax=Panicum miliaceum TaxID=4540 RepID=A0A3L6RNI7_PANMI|nr:hypothetical protein C2845_PM11G29050 [Panicum miliaceum]
MIVKRLSFRPLRNASSTVEISIAFNTPTLETMEICLIGTWFGKRSVKCICLALAAEGTRRLAAQLPCRVQAQGLCLSDNLQMCCHFTAAFLPVVSADLASNASAAIFSDYFGENQRRFTSLGVTMNQRPQLQGRYPCAGQGGCYRDCRFQ